jgi:molybdopterin synthase catalytic subunit
MITVRALLFARYAELLGTDQLVLSLNEGAMARDAVATLRARGAGAALPSTVLLAVNGRQASEEFALADGDELAILPPLAGG